MPKNIVELLASFVRRITTDRACDGSDLDVDDVVTDMAQAFIAEFPESAAIFKEAITEGIADAADLCGESLAEFQPVSLFEIEGT